MTKLLRRGLVVGALLATLVASAPAWAIGAVDDHLPEFLTSVGYGAPAAWMAYEASHGRELDQLFYRDRPAGQKMNLARSVANRGVPVGQLFQFAQRWRTDFDTVATRLEALSGKLPQLHVSMWFVMDNRPWVYIESGGRTTLALNARHFLPYDSTHLRMKVAEAYFHVFEVQESKDQAERLTFARRFQLEGLKLAVVQRGVPSLPLYRYLRVSPTTFLHYQRNQRTIARGLLAALDGQESASAKERFFGRGFGDPWPPGAGRYAAFMLASGIAQERNPLELASMPSRDYLFLVRTQLEEMARVGDGLSP